VSFVNLPSITQENWWTFQPNHNMVGGRPIRWVPDPSGRRWRHVARSLGTGQDVAELARAYRDQTARYGTPRLLEEDDFGFRRAMTRSQPLDRDGTVRVAVFDDTMLEFPWVRSCRALRTGHELVVDRLEAISSGDIERIAAVARALQDCRPTLQLAVLQRGPDGGPGAISPAPDPGGTLREFLDLAFLRSALDGLWPRIYRCEVCGKFNVAKQRLDSRRRAPTRFCIGKSACRAKAGRVRMAEAAAERLGVARRELSRRRRQGHADLIRLVPAIAKKYGVRPATLWKG
jgi:hypothetical protein